METNQGARIWKNYLRRPRKLRCVLEKKLVELHISKEEQINSIKDLERRETEYIRLRRQRIGVDHFDLLTIIGRGLQLERYDSSAHEWGEDYSRYMNPDGVEMSSHEPKAVQHAKEEACEIDLMKSVELSEGAGEHGGMK